MAGKRAPTKADYTKEIYGIIFLAIGSFVTLCLYSYSPLDPSLSSVGSGTPIHNLGGVIGSYLSDFLYMIFGISAYSAPVLLIVFSFLHFALRKVRVGLGRALAFGIFLILAAIFCQISLEEIMLKGQEIKPGGLIGWSLASMMTRYLGKIGAYLFVCSGMLLTLLWLTQVSLKTVLTRVQQGLAIVLQSLMGLVRIILGRTERWAVRMRAQLKASWQRLREARRERAKKKLVIAAPGKKPALASVTRLPTPPAPKARADLPEEPTVTARKDQAPKESTGLKQLKMAITSGHFELPPLSYLDAGHEETPIAIDERALKMNARVLELKLKDFGVEGRVMAIHPGPVITMYEFEPAPGIKVGKIVALSDDLSVIMGGKSVRIVSHLPGKAAIGIEIPNSNRETVWLRDIIANPKFQKSESRLVLAMGKDSEGYPVIADLAKMPHLLVAGATGSGKSVALNVMICSILYKATPDEVRFIMVDPKMLELSVYADIPHLLLPVVTDPTKASQALRWAVIEMDRRYHLMMDAGIRDIVGYNKKLERGELDSKRVIQVGKDELHHEYKLPQLVIIIDELADIMMTCSKDLEDSIMRLAQKARAAGIHLILATQRPSVDVITGVIKANLPTRISFKVSSRHDSRTILDRIGSERLLGDGDMLFLPPNSSDLGRIHGAFITENEIRRVVGHLKGQGKPIYREEILAIPDEEDNFLDMEEGGADDTLYDRAVHLVSQAQHASISMIQRHLRIGYNRAARMIERMESEGVVGPADGSKPREVLVQNYEA